MGTPHVEAEGTRELAQGDATGTVGVERGYPGARCPPSTGLRSVVFRVKDRQHEGLEHVGRGQPGGWVGGAHELPH